MSIDKINDLKLHNGAIAADLHAAAARVIDSGWYAMGPELQQFEQAFARYCGVAHCAGVANGTDALELVLKGAGVGPGDEVIIAANAGMYSGTAILAIGAVPVYADIEPDYLLLDVQSAEAAITAKTRAVIVTHLFGQLAPMEPFIALCRNKGLVLIEDCAQAHGAERDGKRAGSWGDAAAFSFFPTKNLGALGDGGAVVTRSDAIAERVKRLRQYGWSTKYTVIDSGARNSRLDELQAALLAVKLQHLDQWNERRRQIAQAYGQGITHPAIRKPVIAGKDHVGHLYVIRCEQRDLLKQYLHNHGIASDIHYPVLDYQQPAMQRCYPGVQLPVSEAACRTILTLPCYPELTLDEVAQVCDCINRWTP